MISEQITVTLEVNFQPRSRHLRQYNYLLFKKISDLVPLSTGAVRTWEKNCRRETCSRRMALGPDPKVTSFSVTPLASGSGVVFTS